MKQAGRPTIWLDFARICCAVFSLVVLSTALLADDRQQSLEAYDRLIQESDREHWAYRPIRNPAIPDVNHAGWTRSPIDAFILSRLEKQGWRPSPSVSKRTLLRRVYLDLIGVPPGLVQQERFLNDPAPNAFERVVDELLGNPGYGERWGRHWLDLVRYAETNGYERDAEKPSVWRYRDYVIAAFNSDTPFNRFVLEQLAGDELAGRNSATVIATGFFRLGPWDDEPADPKQDRSDQLDDIVRTTSQVFLGITMGCARCHNHKFDPITVHDYYRTVAIFDPLKRPQNGRRERDLPAGSVAQVAALSARDQKISERNKKIGDLRHPFRVKHLKSGQSKLPPEVLEAFRTDEKKRNSKQKELVEKHLKQFEAEVAAAMPNGTKQRLGTLQEQVQQLRRQTPDLPLGYFLTEPSPVAPQTNLLLRGRASLPGPVVQPGFPTVLVARQPGFLKSSEHTTRRRLTMARWIASPKNPLTARVIVNRVWQYHFGEGLVRTPSNFGVSGQSPTHPELLDWLTYWFVNQADWSLKKLHRLILTSSTYRMSKRVNPEYLREDPENELFWRFPYKRMQVEAIRDSMLAVSGQLNHKMYGPSTYLYVPKEALEGHSDPGKIWKPFREPEASRRTVYAFVKRSLVVPMLEVLDLCDTTRSTEKRSITSVAPQALTLFNGNFVNRQAGHLVSRLMREIGDDPERQIERAYLLALCRRPKPAEVAALKMFLKEEAAIVSKTELDSGSPRSQTERHRRALIQMCRVIFNLNEFVYPN